MQRYRHALPQLQDRLFLTDGGLETTLVFHDGIDLPHFAAFTLLEHMEGRQRLLDYYRRYLDIAVQHQVGVVLEAPTWRANRDWAAKLGYAVPALAAANRSAIALMEVLREEYETPKRPIPISGNIGPRSDGYRVDSRMTVDDARAYHGEQIQVFSTSAADFVSAFTLNYVEEAIGIARAARDHNMPVVISFTVETDGCLPSGMTLQQAIEQTDAATDGFPVYYMLNCAHPTHFAGVLDYTRPWSQRVRGLRANASRCSHAELDASTELDAGNPLELGQQYAQLRAHLPNLTVLGGCCGTDHRHVEAIFRQVGRQ